METAETRGRTVDDAVDRALVQLGRRRDQVDVEVVREPRGGFLGLGGGEAIVRVTARPAPSDRDDYGDDEQDEGYRDDDRGGPAAEETSDEGEGGDTGPRRRRRRGRRGGRGRRGRDGGGEQRDDGGEPQAREDDGNGEDFDEDEPPRRDEYERRERGGRGRGQRGGRGGGRGGDRGGRGGRGRDGRGRESRDRRTIEAVHPDDEVKVPGAPPNGPTAIKDAPEDDIDLFGSTLRDLLVLMGLEDTSITLRDPETPGDGVGLISQVFDVFGETDEASDELAVLIGRRGETLNSLQYLLNVMTSRHGESKDVFGVDIEGYRRRREETLVDMAKEIAAEVRATGDVITLEPMPAAERRIIHLALQEEDGVTTESVGRGEDRQVEVMPD